MSDFLLCGLLLAALVVVGILLLVFTAIQKKNDKISEDAIFLTSKKVHYDLWYNLYATFDSVAITKSTVNRLYRQYEILDPGNEKLVKEKAVKTTTLLFGLDIAVFIAVVLIRPSVFTITAALWFIYNATNMIVNNALAKQEQELQKGFSVFMTEVRRNFLNNGMVEEAIYETFDKLSTRMQGHAILIYKTLTAKDVDEALHKYSESAPNQYMKQFVSICATTMKYGDKVIKGQSLFLADVKDLKQTMDNALLQKEAVKSKFRCLDIIILVPIFTMGYIKNWAISVFSGLQKFYDGKWGVVLILGAFVVSIVIQFALNFLKGSKQVDKSDHPILEFLTKWKPIARFIQNYEATYFSKTYRLRMQLKKTGSSYTSGMFLLRQMFMGVGAFLGAMVLMVALNVVQVDMALTDVREVADKGSGTTEYQNITAMALTTHYLYEYKDYDLYDLFVNEVSPGASIKKLDDASITMLKEWFTTKFSESEIDMTDEELIEIIRSYNSNHYAESSLTTVCYGTTDKPSTTDGLDELTLRKVERDYNRIKEMVVSVNGANEMSVYETVANGVYEHVKDYQDASFKWWFVLIGIIAGVGMYWLPIIMLKIHEQELQDFMEDEVIQFQSLIMILMYIDQMTVGTILEEMEKFAFCFKDSIQKCINHLASGEEKALQQLITDEPFEPFVRLVTNLISCDRIGVQQAFNEIDIERQNYIEKRKQEGEIKLNNRATTASFISFFPLYFVIGAYMVVPFIIEAMTSLTESMAGM